MEQKDKWFWVFIGFAILCLVLEVVRVWSCYQDTCCEIHWLFINKEALCPVFTPGYFWV